MGRNRVAEQVLFIGTLWIALATALLCALVPAGLPSSEARGSAFNPANPIVALRAKSNRDLADPIVVARKDDKTPIAGFTPHAVGLIAFFAFSVCHGLARTRKTSAIRLRSVPEVGGTYLGTICPRGPPFD